MSPLVVIIITQVYSEHDISSETSSKRTAESLVEFFVLYSLMVALATRSELVVME